MAAVANDQRIELVVDGRAFQKRVKIIRETIELEFLGLTPFDLIGGFCKYDQQKLWSFCAENSQFHMVSCDGERTYNRHVPDLPIYYIAEGEKNPYLVCNPWVNPLRLVIEEDVFGKWRCEPHEINRRRKR
jgi:hypothetical protein